MFLNIQFFTRFEWTSVIGEFFRVGGSWSNFPCIQTIGSAFRPGNLKKIPMAVMPCYKMQLNTYLILH